ncbi:unnamed protein product [Cuscuta epithymum]|uniref:Rab escort protein 1 n=2 Tax=Cuscuta epithymum TaxID=186058 RepID=A0AAV0G5P3_9ASTE|nr:unnamed protein product [Cuscuta epithymum]
MDDSASYPHIEPSSFDLIVIGTGVSESIIAAAASAAGKSVIHLDPNPFYGSHYASLPLHDFTSFIQSHSNSSSTPHLASQYRHESDFHLVPLCTRQLYSSIDVSLYSQEPMNYSSKFNIDLAGPRVLFCADSMVDLILNTGINLYMEFKSVDGSFIYDGNGNLDYVPDSRSAIFKDRNLSFTEKNQLMRFFKMVQGHMREDYTEINRISQDDLESPFCEFLSKMGLSSKLKSIILYAITLAADDQESVKGYKVIKTRDGIDRLALYHSSVGRFSNAPGAMIYPMYGQGELSQSFCRRAAVKGCINVLRMPVNFILKDKGSGNYKGVKLASGQELLSHNLILAPPFVIPFDTVESRTQSLQDDSLGLDKKDVVKEKLVKGICIAKSSLKPDVANCLVFFPPQSLIPEQVSSIHVFQISSNVAVCPSGMFVTYLSVTCEDAVQGKKLLEAAINALFYVPVSGTSQNDHTDHPNSIAKPAILWSTLYVQELTKEDSFDSVASVSMPDGNLHYNEVLAASVKIFERMYPGEDFLPKAATSSEEEEHV